VGYCYRRAGECKELAELATSPSDKAFYMEREQGWLLLARSYELQDRSALFAKEHQCGRQRSRLPRSCPCCAGSKAKLLVANIDLYQLWACC
jgi:hypothetical protein